MNNFVITESCKLGYYYIYDNKRRVYLLSNGEVKGLPNGDTTNYYFNSKKTAKQALTKYNRSVATMFELVYKGLSILKSPSDRIPGYYIPCNKPGTVGYYLNVNGKVLNDLGKDLKQFYFATLKAAKQAILNFRYPNIKQPDKRNITSTFLKYWYINIPNKPFDDYLHNDGVARPSTRNEETGKFSGYFASRSNAISCYEAWLKRTKSV